MIRFKCLESHIKFLGSYLFNLRMCLFKIFPDCHFWNHTLEKSDRTIFVNMHLGFLLAACANSLVDSFPYNHMSCLWSLIWTNRISGSWHLIIRLEITVQSSTMGFWTVSFLKLTLGSGCLNFVTRQSLWQLSWLINITKIPVAFKSELRRNLTHMSFLNLTHKLSVEPWFRMFIINVFYAVKFTT